MRRILGLDGCKAGWLGLLADLDSRSCEVRLLPHFAAVEPMIPLPQVIAVDIPIGLPESGERACDRLARERLGRRRAASVFPVPARAVLAARTRQQASPMQERLDGRRIGVQTWSLVAKLRDADQALQRFTALRARTYEVHPEVSFAFWNGGEPMRHAKRTPAGRAERLALARRHWGAAAGEVLASFHARYAASDATLEDLIDAFACLWSAERIARGEAGRLPAEPPRDATGLPMAISY